MPSDGSTKSIVIVTLATAAVATTMPTSKPTTIARRIADLLLRARLPKRRQQRRQVRQVDLSVVDDVRLPAVVRRVHVRAEALQKRGQIGQVHVAVAIDVARTV